VIHRLELFHRVSVSFTDPRTMRSRDDDQRLRFETKRLLVFSHIEPY